MYMSVSYALYTSLYKVHKLFDYEVVISINGYFILHSTFLNIFIFYFIP